MEEQINQQPNNIKTQNVQEFHFSLSKSKLKKIILAVAAVFIVGVGAYRLGARSINTLPISPSTPVPSSEPTSIPSNSDCENLNEPECNKRTYCKAIYTPACPVCPANVFSSCIKVNSIEEKCRCVSDPNGCSKLSLKECEKNPNCHLFARSGSCGCPICEDYSKYCLPGKPKKQPTPTPTPTPVKQTKLPSQQELFNLAKTRKAEILANSGTVATDLKFTDLEQFGENVYLISFAYLDSQGNQIPTGGGWALVGKVTSGWNASIPHESQYCTWLKNSDKDPATKAFMGIERCN